MKGPKISVVVPTRNRWRDLKRCLDSLMRQSLRDVEVIVIDNGSTDDTPKLLKSYPVRVVRDETENLAHLFNVGWRKASADIVAYINDDAEAHPFWLENIIKAFDESDDVGAVGGPTIATRKQEILSLHETARSSRLLGIIAKIYETVVLEGKLFDVGVLCESGAYSVGGSLSWSAKLDRPFSVDLLTITNMAARKTAIGSVGGFDEGFRFWHIDGDFFVRLKGAGYKLIFDPKVVVWHHLSQVGATRRAYHIGRGTAHFLLKSIRPSSFGGWLRYMLNMAFFNFYWLHKAWTCNDAGLLGGIVGFANGIRDHFRRRGEGEDR